MATAHETTLEMLHTAHGILHSATSLLTFATNVSEGSSWESGTVAAKVWQLRNQAAACQGEIGVYLTALREKVAAEVKAAAIEAEAEPLSGEDPFAEE